MSKNNMLYTVIQYTDEKDSIGRVVYSSTKRDKAYKFVRTYSEEHPLENIRMTIDARPMHDKSRRDLMYEDEDL